MVLRELDRTLAEQKAVLTTRAGVELRLRPVEFDDGVLLFDLFDRLGPDGLRFRYLHGQSHPTLSQIAALLEVDHRRVEHLLAFTASDTSPVASLLIAADAQLVEAEVAIAVAEKWRRCGIGYALLRHATDLATERGLRVLRAVESRANCDAIETERKLGFKQHAYDGDPELVILEKDLA